MLKRINANGDSKLTPREGTCLIGSAMCLFALVSVYFVKRFKRRHLLIPGHLLMGTCHVLVGVFAILGHDGLVILFMIGFIMFYEVLNGASCWVYTSEVAVDVALGLCLGTLWGTVFVLSLVTNFLMNSALHVQGVFWLFGGISFIGAGYCHIFIKETYGLNDKEKKQLYMPKPPSTS